MRRLAFDHSQQPLQEVAVVVVHTCDQLSECAADELLAVRARPDEVRCRANQAADGQAQCKLAPRLKREQRSLDGATARQRKP